MSHLALIHTELHDSRVHTLYFKLQYKVQELEVTGVVFQSK